MSPFMDTLYMFLETFNYILAALCAALGIFISNMNAVCRALLIACAFFCVLSAFYVGHKRKAILQQEKLEKKKKKQNLIAQIEAETIEETNPHAHLIQFINGDIAEKCTKRFIAIDIETTGLSLEDDKIIKISAVRFEDLIPVKRFATLVNPRISISPEVSKITGITNAMVKDAPTEQKAILDFIHFIGSGAMMGDTILVVHNAKFNINFIRLSFARIGMPADLTYMDTLSICKRCVHDVENYKLRTLAEHFNISQLHEHHDKDKDDAETCGQIFVELLQMNK